MLEKIKAKFFTGRFLTFGLIGGFNTVLAQVLYMIFVKLGVQVSLASIAGDVLSMASSYFLNMKFTWRMKPSWRTAVTFPLSYLPGTAIAALAVWIISDVCGGPEIYAKLLSLPFTIPLNYLVMGFIVKKSGGRKEETK
ncbi:MAG: GtrA family protein [Solobacterium sp.]|nr:GtrA family protein [Solobacterium sp.]